MNWVQYLPLVALVLLTIGSIIMVGACAWIIILLRRLLKGKDELMHALSDPYKERKEDE
jgi:hypothetical protein